MLSMFSIERKLPQLLASAVIPATCIDSSEPQSDFATPAVAQVTKFARSKRIGLLQLLFLVLAMGSLTNAFGQSCSGGTCSANSCSQADVQNAINAAISGGDQTVSIPAGTCTWTSTVSAAPTGPLTIKGQTTCSGSGAPPSTLSCTDSTVITDDVNRGSGDVPALKLTAGSSPLRLTGITLIANSSTPVSYNGSLAILGTSTQVRVDHDDFNFSGNQGGDWIGIDGCVYGVMDHSIVSLAPSTTQNGIRTMQGTCGGDSSSSGNGQWNEPTGLGSANSFYVEDSLIKGGLTSSSQTEPFVNDCSYGGRFVFRYNTIDGAEFQDHGTGHATDSRACRSFEVYGNALIGASDSGYPARETFFMTGGTGLIWGNALSGYIENLVTALINRVTDSTYKQVSPPSGWGYCGSSPIGGVPGPSDWDGNQPGQNGYPCLDQIGRGTSDLLQGTFPNKCDATQGCKTYDGTWPNQALEPVYEWADTGWSKVPSYDTSTLWSSENSQIQQNRDYYLWCNPSSTDGCTSFNGTAGVGSGPLASRPTTCTQGVAYWATDQGSWNQGGSGSQGQLFVCTAANTWSLYYTPYTYPHPLTGATTSQATPPAPIGLQGVVTARAN